MCEINLFDGENKKSYKREKREMNIKFTDTSNIRIRAKKMKPLSPIPFSISSHPSKLSPFNIYEERPLKTNSQNLSFKGLSLNHSGVKEIINKFGDDFGTAAKKNFEEQLNKAHLRKKLIYDKTNNTVTFKEQTFGKRLFDVLIYPVKEMPLDLANSVIKVFSKIPNVKKTSAFESLSNIKALKNRREELVSTSHTASFQKYFNLQKEGKHVFKEGLSRFNPLVSNYDSTTERTLTRVVTGAIPAFFLANDAYNLSIYMNNNKDLAKKEKSRRFNQEAARIGITAAATFGVLKLFSKSSNASASMTNYLLAGVTLFSEFIGRAAAGNPVMPLSSKKARTFAEKQGKIKKEETENKNDGAHTKFSSNLETKKAKEKEAPPKKGKMTFKNAFKVLGLLVAAGFGVDKASNIKSVRKVLNNLNNTYKGLYTKDLTINRGDFEKLTEKLKSAGFESIAAKYKKYKDEIIAAGNLNRKESLILETKIDEIVKEQLPKEKMNSKELNKAINEIKNNIDTDKVLKDLGISKRNDDVIYLGITNNKAKHVLIHHLLTFPVRFTWNTLMSPYKFVKKTVLATKNMGKKGIQKGLPSNKQTLKDSLQYLQKIDKKPDFAKRVNASILSSLDTETKSNYANSELAAVVKNTTSAITSGFLIIDNYNLVMIDTQGKDKPLAEQKAKERTIQRGVRLLYGAFLLKMFNGIFSNTYNTSLLGASAVNTMYAVSTETLERTSVGLPLKESTREEIAKNEKKNLNASGFKGEYYRLMAKLTGKKPIAEMQNDKNKKR